MLVRGAENPSRRVLSPARALPAGALPPVAEAGERGGWPQAAAACPACVGITALPLVARPAGANAGYSTVLFKLLWPEATVVMLEPDSSNFAMLRRNTAL